MSLPVNEPRRDKTPLSPWVIASLILGGIAHLAYSPPWGHDGDDVRGRPAVIEEFSGLVTLTAGTPSVTVILGAEAQRPMLLRSVSATLSGDIRRSPATIRLRCSAYAAAWWS